MFQKKGLKKYYVEEKNQMLYKLKYNLQRMVTIHIFKEKISWLALWLRKKNWFDAINCGKTNTFQSYLKNEEVQR